MNNKPSYDLASDMLTKLASPENVALFRKDYVVAEDENDAKHVETYEDDSNDAQASEEDTSNAEDDSSDENDSDDVSLALDTAVASLLSASAALDAVGFEKSASLSLKLASFVVDAKKKQDVIKNQKDFKKHVKDVKKEEADKYKSTSKSKSTNSVKPKSKPGTRNKK